MNARAAAELKTTLQGVTLPAEKPALLEYAVRRHAEPVFLSALRSLPDREYESLDDVVEDLLRVQPPGGDDYVTPHPSDTGQVRDLDQV